MSGLPEPWEILIPIREVPSLDRLRLVLRARMGGRRYTIRVERNNYSIRGHFHNPSLVLLLLRRNGAWRPNPQAAILPPRDRLTPP
ncbi:hypothetical protein ACHAPT_002394 [Fusarium lateritium]